MLSPKNHTGGLDGTEDHAYGKIFASPDSSIPNISDHVAEHFPKFLKIVEDFQGEPKIAEDLRGKSEDVSIIH